MIDGTFEPLGSHTMRPLLLATLLALGVPALAGEPAEPLTRYPSRHRKTLWKAILGDERSREQLAELAPLGRKAAEEAEQKVLQRWPLSKAKGGRETHELEVGGATREYCVSIPKRYTPKRSWPLILSLHGAGGNGPGEIDFIWTRHLDEWPGFIAAPSGQPPGAQWFPEQEAFVLAVLRDVQERYNIDANRVYLNGFSNGGNGAWYHAQHHPGRFAAVCTRGGGNPSPGLLVNLLHVPVYIIHGEQDGTIRVDSDRRSAQQLRELGYTVTYTEMAGVGHRPGLDENPKVLEFFQEHPRDPWPRTLRFRPDAEGFRNLWLEVPAGAGGGEVEATVEGNRITITGARRVVLWLADGLVDLDQDVTVVLDGEEVHAGPVPRRLPDLLQDLDARFDRNAPAWARLELPPDR
jgi:predicted esterase